MEIEIFTLCDAATDWMGKLNILGSFDQINLTEFPKVYPYLCAIGLRVRFERIEEGRHTLKINFVNADGKPVRTPIDGEINVRFGGDGQWLCANLAFPIAQLKFEAPGNYSIDLAIDGRQERSLPLRVVLVKPSRPAPEPTK